MKWNGFSDASLVLDSFLSLSFALLLGLSLWPCSSFFVHRLEFKGNVPCVLNDGLSCFACPRAWKIASLREFPLWLEIAGNALK